MKTAKTVLSGIQPSGDLMLGNYIGALKRWVEMQDAYECFFMLVDLHAITVQQVPAMLRTRCVDGAAIYIAVGLDPSRSALFLQSQVSAHSELAWVLSCVSYIGELNKMTQFKEKAKEGRSGIGVGLFTYPVLMAADILLYQSDLVPVGDDQRQHLEFTRDLAGRFNKRFGRVFTIPEALIPTVGARIMSLQDPTRKMSKSDGNRDASVSLLDSADIIRRKVRRAVTDSGTEIRPADVGPAVGNLISICSALTGETPVDLLQRFAGASYKALKDFTSDVVIGVLTPIQQRYRELRGDETELVRLLEVGANRAEERAEETLRAVKDSVGFVPRRRP